MNCFDAYVYNKCMFSQHIFWLLKVKMERFIFRNGFINMRHLKCNRNQYWSRWREQQQVCKLYNSTFCFVRPICNMQRWLEIIIKLYSILIMTWNCFWAETAWAPFIYGCKWILSPISWTNREALQRLHHNQTVPIY